MCPFSLEEVAAANMNEYDRVVGRLLREKEARDGLSADYAPSVDNRRAFRWVPRLRLIR